MIDKQNKNIIWIVVACILSISLIISSSIFTAGIKQAKSSNNTLSVRGSAKKQITSDLAVWNGSFNVKSSNLSEAYRNLKDSEKKVRDYLIRQGFNQKDMVFSSISTETNYVILPNGSYSSQIDSYKLSQSVEIKSKDVNKISDISRKSTDLINEGIEFQSNSPQYFYTKLSDLKIDMITLATKDSQTRADKMLSVTGNKVGKLKSASIGVFQITPLYSDEISDYGINDTSSIEKEITSVITCEFEVK